MVILSCSRRWQYNPAKQSYSMGAELDQQERESFDRSCRCPIVYREIALGYHEVGLWSTQMAAGKLTAVRERMTFYVKSRSEMLRCKSISPLR